MDERVKEALAWAGGHMGALELNRAQGMVQVLADEVRRLEAVITQASEKEIAGLGASISGIVGKVLVAMDDGNLTLAKHLLVTAMAKEAPSPKQDPCAGCTEAIKELDSIKAVDAPCKIVDSHTCQRPAPAPKQEAKCEHGNRPCPHGESSEGCGCCLHCSTPDHAEALARALDNLLEYSYSYTDGEDTAITEAEKVLGRAHQPAQEKKPAPDWRDLPGSCHIAGCVGKFGHEGLHCPPHHEAQEKSK
jgi:hypothetical protein